MNIINKKIKNKENIMKNNYKLIKLKEEIIKSKIIKTENINNNVRLNKS